MNPLSIPDDAFELLVLEGEQQGARTRVPLHLPVTVSGRPDSDVVLRGAGLDGVRIALTAKPAGLHVAVLEGTATLADRSLAAGEQADVAPGTRIGLGQSAIGVGPVPSAAAAPAPELAAEVVPPEAEPVAAAVAVRPPPRRWWQGLVVGGGALAAVSIGMLAFAYTAVPAPLTPQQQAARAEAVLHGAGLSRLVAKPDAGANGIVVNGYLETAAQRARAESLLAADGLPARFEVWVNEQVATSVVDVYRVNGVTAQAETTGPGAVSVTTREADVQRLDEIRAIARRDVPGLAALEVHNAAPRAARAAQPVVDDPGKRVASIVPGAPPYVVTADGTRYFEGALLPTGHRIAAIEQHQVLLEKDGDRTPLLF